VFAILAELKLLSCLDSCESIAQICLGSIQLCDGFSVRPTPIRFLNAALSTGFRFDLASLGAFFAFFANLTDIPVQESEFCEECFIEILRAALVVIETTPDFTFPWEELFPKLLAVLPPGRAVPVEDIYARIARLPGIPAFSQLQSISSMIFACMIRTLALPDNRFADLGLGPSLCQAIIHLISPALQPDSPFYASIPEIVNGGSAAIDRRTRRLNSSELI
jgi:hypothetical protein